MDCFILPSPAPLFAQAAPVRSLRRLVLVMAAPAAALEEELAAMEAADAADLAAAPAAEAAHPELLLPKQPTLLQQPLLWQKLPMLPKHLLVLLIARH